MSISDLHCSIIHKISNYLNVEDRVKFRLAMPKNIINNNLSFETRKKEKHLGVLYKHIVKKKRVIHLSPAIKVFLQECSAQDPTLQEMSHVIPEVKSIKHKKRNEDLIFHIEQGSLTDEMIEDIYAYDRITVDVILKLASVKTFCHIWDHPVGKKYITDEITSLGATSFWVMFINGVVFFNSNMDLCRHVLQNPDKYKFNKQSVLEYIIATYNLEFFSIPEIEKIMTFVTPIPKSVLTDLSDIFIKNMNIDKAIALEKVIENPPNFLTY